MATAFLISYLIVRLSFTTATMPNATASVNNALYWEGTAPLIILAQLDGDLALDLPDRQHGCIASGSSDCQWNSTQCPSGTSRSSSSCKVYTGNWGYTKEIAQCLYQTINITNAQDQSLGNPHLIMNNLQRIKLDSDREINEGAQGNSVAEATWNQIHQTFTDTAVNKIKTDKKCGFGGLIIDITGHSYTEDIHFRYKLYKSYINELHTLNSKLNQTSIKRLIKGKNENVTSAVLGTNSLSKLFENADTQSFSVLPPSATPTPEITTSYTSGNEATLNVHGSQNSDSKTDAIQIALKSTIRFGGSTKRGTFCQDFSNAITEYMKYWYSNDMASCCTVAGSCDNPSPSPAPTDAPSQSPTAPPTFSPTYQSTTDYQSGDHNYTGYRPGNGPLIILSQHGGILERGSDENGIYDRDSGCIYETCQSNCDCITWPGSNGNCPSGQTKSSAYCGVITQADGKTQELATCVYNKIADNNLFNNGDTIFKPHLILSNLHRSKLDPNREIFTAAQGNAKAIKAWEEINLKWIPEAAQRNMDRCDFGGLILDIHGQAKNDYNHIGYDLGWKSSSTYPINATTLTQDHLDRISIKSLIEGKSGADITEALRGTTSFQYYLSQQLTGTVNNFSSPIPLRDGTFWPTPTPSNFFYYVGGHSIDLFGSQNSSSITDAIQIEVPNKIRYSTDGADRDVFCTALANAITNYVEQWYDLSKCNYGGKDDGAAFDQGRHEIEKRDVLVKQIIVFSILGLFTVVAVVIGILLIRKYKLKKAVCEQSDNNHQQPLTPVEVVEIPNISMKMPSTSGKNVESNMAAQIVSQQTK